MRFALVPLSVLALVVGSSSCSSSDTGAGTPDAGVDPPSDAGVVDGNAVRDGANHEEDGGTPPTATYTNPVLPADFPDPFILREGSTYYAFATNAGTKNVPAASSPDLVTWTTLPDAMPALPAWALTGASLTWAPSILKRGASYVLYYTARSKAAGFQCIGRAVAAQPQGPYVDDSAEPFICQVQDAQALCGSIDASPVVATNGDAYILWKSDENAAACQGDARIWSQRLGIDGLSLIGAPSELMKRDRNWEAPLVEGPSMIENGGMYYLFYSANWWESGDYGVGYAICTTPAGPCVKKTLDGPLVKSQGGALGPGGQEFFTDPAGKLWMSYHAWSAPIVGYSNGGKRSLRVDPVVFSGGVPSLVGPSTTASPL
ncbi:MAG: glycoside hydrolase, family 43 [Labilithrix sp.]|nr:glycoside hydrolase, family 43 [Labilithrix sp.]